ncbi:MerR family transcriptional regulator [Nocardioides perillae]|uniref:DNA-binding transcriptional MerR regulator n=1 Tax=Nocardioides perillae TaxID=1119534 RepID=A0A7Y9RRL7_9ACTN|nr:MerR family transcriptional regulator [Nocardioides perillae]NYG55060.1 DNA-binding transcriptional MerR regulator [Nocardioides perillae]
MVDSEGEEPGQALLTVDELAAAVGLTVRTTRYYASLGLLPPPQRRGRVAVYDERHRARLEMVRALQDHGFTLQAVERYLSSVPLDAGVEDLALQRAMLTSWTTEPPQQLSRAQLEERAGRRLTDDDLDVLLRMGAVERAGRRWVAMPHLAVGVGLLELDLPVTALESATKAITRHMESLAEELTTILHTDLVVPFRSGEHSPEESARFERTYARLRQLTLEAVVSGFQRAANDVIARALTRR